MLSTFPKGWRVRFSLKEKSQSRSKFYVCMAKSYLLGLTELIDQGTNKEQDWWVIISQVIAVFNLFDQSETYLQ